MSCGRYWLFWGIKSQNFQKVYKIKVENQTFSYLVLNFYNNQAKLEAARAFSVFVGQTEASTESVGIFPTLAFRNFGSLSVGQTNVPQNEAPWGCTSFSSSNTGAAKFPKISWVQTFRHKLSENCSLNISQKCISYFTEAAKKCMHRCAPPLFPGNRGLFHLQP